MSRATASTATRLLCVGVYRDPSFRAAVIEELYVREERFVAPSPGADMACVLAHALRARRVEAGFAAVTLLLWGAFGLFTQGLVLLWLVPFLFVGLSDVAGGRVPEAAPRRMVAAGALTLCGVLAAVLTVPLLTGGALGVWGAGRDDVPEVQTLLAFLFPFALAEVVDLRWRWLASVLHRELSAEGFSGVRAGSVGPRGAATPVRRGTDRFRRVSRRIEEEQHARLVMYRPENPFCGVGVPNEPWSLSVELRPREGQVPEPVDNRTILGHLVPTLERLRTPSRPGGTSGVRDRLRLLEIEEVVFLPVEGLPHRDVGPGIMGSFDEHRAQAVEEGGEARRYYLRISVVGWDGQLVVTVFVRVHTQGGILVLELVPFTLHPVKAAYRRADREAREWRRGGPWERTSWVFRRVPGATFAGPVTLLRQIVSVLRGAGRGRSLPDGPAVSVRELGSDAELPPFPAMDAQRYLTSIKERVATEVRQALHEAGWQTGEFERKVVSVASGGIFIESAHGAVGIGDGNTVTTHMSGAQSAGNAQGEQEDA
ncbi:hypothetical protein PV689_11505 [Streptomyces sp. ATCC51928]|uniref:Uncharacterized protein n=2 Tax=Streptomyces TaxID=1883 RepID=A0ABW2M9G8_9ACTN|nr:MULTISPECIES: hypothetical protein [unclassified Streptomyces]MDX3502541.1 hypothetical protein [Streptomyces sp. ATCC51928]MDX5523879.1 hypothetical protein [Streptomyces sp. DE06-01C]